MNLLNVLVNGVRFVIPGKVEDSIVTIEVGRGYVSFDLSREDDNYYGGAFDVPVDVLRAIIAGAKDDSQVADASEDHGDVTER